MMDPRQWTFVQWLAFAAFALSTAASASWWADYMSAQTAALVHNGLLYGVTLLTFMLTGAPPKA